jgi:hypothetical protein
MEVGVALSIKTEEADSLARALAGLTGEMMTEAVTVALRERLARERREVGEDSYQPAFVLTHEEWVNAGRHASLFGARPPAIPARDTNPWNGRKSRPFQGLV